MNEKKTFGEEVKEWWHDNKKVIKAGIICGLAGFAYGFIKATNTLSNMMIKGDITVEKPEKIDWDAEEINLDECDDPELVELINLETENTYQKEGPV